MNNKKKYIIAGCIIIVFITIGLILGLTHKESGSIGQGSKGVFTEIPFIYKADKNTMQPCDANSPDLLCPTGITTYEDTYAKHGLWYVDPLNDPTKSICQSLYTKTCTAADKTNCNLDQGDPLLKGNGDKYSGWCNYYGNQVENPFSICCNVGDYAHAKPQWNWIIGTCKGYNCQNLDYHTDAKNHGTDLIVNYVGAYQYDQKSEIWVCQQDSSFNMDGKHNPQDIMKVDENWLPGPLPGGASNWGYGYYPAGRTGVGAPAFAFILSVEKMFNVAWYMLNQATLDRGPANKMGEVILQKIGLNPEEAAGVVAASNTWLSARSGEWDILETTMLSKDTTQNPDYLNLYSNTATNPGSNGICLHHGNGDISTKDENQSGGWFTKKYFVGDNYINNESNPRVFFVVMDTNGTTVFQIPTYDGAPEYWRGIGRKSAWMNLPGKFTGSDPVTGACSDPTKFCATFMPSCAAKTPDDIKTYNCSVAGADAGWCGNFIANSLVSTHNVWGNTKAFDGKVEWTKEMQTLNS
jgi:hypothetical protein